ncbi:hypothetical protein D9758_004798 [Tetrapyrgos nigripes]|uniref:Uncharacterized protein n=1 Tax=Tetrapyrgos nigripes TaxID=182062 RepID=A0A8H5G657_9AGAR|nr:hypothetical protein D9758_004798 [Tetrapyrgos nigripes]
MGGYTPCKPIGYRNRSSSPTEVESGNTMDTEDNSFQNALQIAFESVKDFHGSWTFSLKPVTDARKVPDPALTVDGVGCLRLPLDEAQAQVLIEKAQQASITSNGPVKIDASELHFLNSEFNSWLRKTLDPKVAAAFGLQPSDMIMQLSKLLLFEGNGSHLQATQTTENAPGMFATVLVSLPCEHTGGELVLTHSNSTTTYESSTTSLDVIDVTGWYTGVCYEVKPVTSGYRLCLCFNLFHAIDSASGIPRLDSAVSSDEGLRAVLTKWKDNRNLLASKSGDTVAYVLNGGQYGSNYDKLRSGIRFLDDEDARLVSNVRNVAEGLGFFLGIAMFELNRGGNIDSDDSWSGDDLCYGFVTEDNRYRLMTEVFETNSQIWAFHDLDGVKMEHMELECSSLILKNDFFDKNVPTFQGYAVVDRSYEQWEQSYNLTALIIIHGDKPYCTRLRAFQMIQRLEKASIAASEPSSAEKESVHELLKSLPRLQKEQVYQLMHCACLWKDNDLLDGVMKGVDLQLGEVSRYFEVWDVFGWEIFSERIQPRLRQMKGLSTKYEFLEALSTHPSSVQEAGIVREWRDKVFNAILRELQEVNKLDVPIMFSLIEKHGMKWFMEQVFPNLPKEIEGSTLDLHAFWKEFVKGLLDKYAGKEPTEYSSAVGTATFPPTTPLLKSLKILVELCIDTGPAFRTSLWNTSDVAETVTLSVRAHHPEVCAELFKNLLERDTRLVYTLENHYGSLIKRLDQVEGLDIFAMNPFSQFIKTVITEYMRRVLGPKPAGIHDLPTQPFGCGSCEECSRVDEFLKDQSANRRSLDMHQNSEIIQHLSKYLDDSTDRVSYKVASKSRRGKNGKVGQMDIVKKPKYKLASRWRDKVIKGKAFLERIGNANVIRVMGDDYDTVVVKALEGLAGAGTSAPVQGQRNASSLPAGKKRKAMD